MGYDIELGYMGNIVDDSLADEPEENDYCDIEETTQTKRVRVCMSFDIDVEVDGWINRDGDFDTDSLEDDIKGAVTDLCKKYKLDDPELIDWEVLKD